MTYASQLSPDYFSHKPRSFLSLHTDFDEKLTQGLETPDRGRRPSRLVGYEQPVPNAVPNSSPRVPRSRTLIRLLLLVAISGLVSVGWRCEAFGCKSRGGGALVGDYIGGGSVVAGWGTPEGMDLSAIWGRPSWGGERQRGEKDQGSSTLYASQDDLRDEEGELVGFAGVNEDGEVEWDDEGGKFGSAGLELVEGGEKVQLDGGEQVQEQMQGMQGEGAIEGEQQGVVVYELYEPPLDEDIAGPVGEMTGPVEGIVEDVAAAAVAQQDAVSNAQPDVQQDDRQVSESAPLAQKDSLLGAMDGLW